MLRAEQIEDLAELSGGESPFDDFGPSTIAQQPRPSALDGAGELVVIASDGAVAGRVSWHWVRWGPSAASLNPMIGIWLKPAYRGRGLGREAQAELAELLFRHTQTNRVEAHTDVENFAEQKALEAAGFQCEGRIRGAQWRDAEFHDMFLYARLRDTE